MTLVSVVMPTHNRRGLLREALESVAQQTLGDVEVVLVNDGGEDVGDLVAEFDGRLAIRYLTYAEPRERSAARNLALEHARGTYIAYLDDDDVFYPEHLERLVDALETTGASVAYSDGVECRYVVGPGGAQTVVERRVLYASAFDRDRLFCENYIAINCILHRKACLDRVGAFDVELGVPLEDWDLWVRLACEWDFHHVPGATAEFRTRVDEEYTRNLDRAPFYFNALRVFVKYADHVRDRPDLMRRQLQHLNGLVNELESRASSRARAATPSPAAPADGRPFATLAFVDELMADPELLAAYGRHFDSNADATLVIYAPGYDEARLEGEFGPVADAAGISAEGSAALVALVDPSSSAMEQRLAADSDAVLTNRPSPHAFAGLPHFTATDVGRLRTLADGGLTSAVAR